MKKTILLLICFLALHHSHAQTTDKEGVKKACLNYLEGFYHGDASKLTESLQPTLNKFGFWKNKETGKYEQEEAMTYEEALNYAERVFEKKHFVSSKAPKEVEVLDVGNVIASAKVTAWWGIDYLLLSKRGDKWMIEQVLWEGPLEKTD